MYTATIAFASNQISPHVNTCSSVSLPGSCKAEWNVERILPTEIHNSSFEKPTPFQDTVHGCFAVHLIRGRFVLPALTHFSNYGTDDFEYLVFKKTCCHPFHSLLEKLFYEVELEIYCSKCAFFHQQDNFPHSPWYFCSCLQCHSLASSFVTLQNIHKNTLGSFWKLSCWWKKAAHFWTVN